MNKNLKVFGNKEATVRALFCCPLGIHWDYCATSLFRFVAHDPQELSPGNIMKALGNITIADHLTDIKVFVGNEIVLQGKLLGHLVVEIQPLPLNFQVGLGYQQPGLAPSVRALGLGTQTLLPLGQTVFALFEVSRISNHRPIGERCEGSDAHVDAHRIRWGLSWLDLPYITAEDSIPLATDTLDSDSLNSALDRPMQVDTDFTYILDVELICKPDSVTIRGKGDRAKTIPALESRITRILSIPAPVEECLEGLIEASQDILGGREVQGGTPRVFLPDTLDLIGLVIVVEGNSAFPSITFFLECCIIEGAGNIQQAGQGFILRPVGVQPIYEGLSHSLSLLSLYVFSDCCLADLPYSSNIVAARPKAGETRTEFGKLGSHNMRRISFELAYNVLDCLCRSSGNEYMNMIRHDFYHLQFDAKLLRLQTKKFLQTNCNIAHKYLLPIFGAPYQMILDIVDAPCVALISFCHAPNCTDDNKLGQYVSRKEGCNSSAT